MNSMAVTNTQTRKTPCVFLVGAARQIMNSMAVTPQ